jgi:hypothetical protein
MFPKAAGKLRKKSAKNTNPSGFQKLIHLGTSSFQKPFYDRTSGFLNPINQQEFSLRTPGAFRKIGIIGQHFHRSRLYIGFFNFLGNEK